jgi:hypothetical protein
LIPTLTAIQTLLLLFKKHMWVGFFERGAARADNGRKPPITDASTVVNITESKSPGSGENLSASPQQILQGTQEDSEIVAPRCGFAHACVKS